MYDYLKMNDYKLSEVYPPLEKDRIEDFLEDYEKYDDINLQKHKSLDDIPEKVQKLLKQVYIGGVLKNKPAIKARFLQYKLYSDEFSEKKIIDEDVQEDEFQIDLILEDEIEDNIVYPVFIVEVLDKKLLYKIKKQVNNFNEFLKKKNRSNKKKKNSENYKPVEHVYLICGSIDRTVALDLERLNSQDSDFKFECIIEYEDPDRNFNDDDLIIIDDTEIRGFNFGSLGDVLSVLKNMKGKGRYTIYSKSSRGFKKIIWEGYIYPKKIFKFL